MSKIDESVGYAKEKEIWSSVGDACYECGSSRIVTSSRVENIINAKGLRKDAHQREKQEKVEARAIQRGQRRKRQWFVFVREVCTPKKLKFKLRRIVPCLAAIGVQINCTVSFIRKGRVFFSCSLPSTSVLVEALFLW